MTGPVLRHLGETRLELGPARDAAREGHWRHAKGPDGIVWMILDAPGDGPNTISRAVMAELGARLERLEETPPKALVLRSGKPAGFAAGGDIAEFSAMDPKDVEVMLRDGHRIVDRLADLPCPTIAVVHGEALGGGFELALACDWRIAVDGAAFGMPETRLGLHPGLGGTFRLTGLIDQVEAMQLMLTGKKAHTKKAKALGIADVVTQERHVAAAVRACADGEVEPRRKGGLAGGLKSGALKFGRTRSLAARQMRARTQEKAPQEHYPAPSALIDLWETHGDDPAAMQDAEIRSFASLLATDAAKNLVRVFFLRQALKQRARGDDEIAHVHVVGAGEMGAEIAAWAAISGKTVSLSDVKLDVLGEAVKTAAGVCEGAHLSPAETRDALDRMMPDPNGYGAKRADLVIEAVPEKPELKAKIYESVGAEMKPDAILATNTSSLRLEALSRSVKNPERFAGLHFFNPVSKMQLVEVVRTRATDARTSRRLAAYCGAIDRLPAPVRDHPGFLVNRALTPYLMEAVVLLDEGVPKEVIDRAALRFGMPMGPIALADQVGLDICLDVADSLRADLEKPIPDVPDWMRRMVEDGRQGKKTGQGFYDWSGGRPDPGEGETGPEDLTDRLILPMLDACVECLRRDVAEDEDEVDGAMVFATGFAPFRGGPMKYARDRGHATVRERLAALAERHGPRFAPDEGWSRYG
ncbi:3-hydroxyacyl-CoA dehydrogenase NAD-binding domain-containing protein [Salinarimonas sp.]|uniref:3-hydroxyacyl-CoA dehydrogenase NAD-binding domain-containing protein n=1 Tax=Salinarimonas sp. TaxID=2766526 RepID=UPI0032D8C99B